MISTYIRLYQHSTVGRGIPNCQASSFRFGFTSRLWKVDSELRRRKSSIRKLMTDVEAAGVRILTDPPKSWDPPPGLRPVLVPSSQEPRFGSPGGFFNQRPCGFIKHFVVCVFDQKQVICRFESRSCHFILGPSWTELNITHWTPTSQKEQASQFVVFGLGVLSSSKRQADLQANQAGIIS